MDNENKLKTMAIVIEDLNKENEDLRSRYADLRLEFDLYKADNKDSMQKAKEMIVECSTLAEQYKNIIKELEIAKKQYRKALKDVNDIKDKYRGKVNRIIDDIK